MLVPGRPQGEYLLFCRERNPGKELWDGSRAGQEGAIDEFGADDAFPIDDIDDIIPGLIEGCSRVYYTMGMYTDFDAHIAEWVNSLRSGTSRGSHTAASRLGTLGELDLNGANLWMILDQLLHFLHGEIAIFVSSKAMG